MLVDRVAIAAGGVALPQLDQGARHRPRILIEHTPGDDDSFAERRARVSLRQVGGVRAGPAIGKDRSGDLGKVCSSRIGGCFGARLTVLA